MVLGLAILGAVVVWGLGAAPASAADCLSGTTEWTNGAGGNWFDAANWSNGVPSPACSAVIASAGTYTVDLGPHGGEVRGITLGGASGTQTLHQSGERLAVGARGLTIGTNGVLAVESGEISIPDGSVRLDGGTLWLAAVPGASLEAEAVKLGGTLRVTGHAPLDSGPLVVLGSADQSGTFSNVVFDDQTYEVDYDRGAVSLWPPGSTCVSGSTAWANPHGGGFDDPANWTNGRPSAACDAFITVPGTYVVGSGRGGSCGGNAHSLTIGGASGTQTLANENYGSGLACPDLSTLMHFGPGGMVVNPHGSIEMTSGELDVDGSVEFAGEWHGWGGSIRAGGGFHNTSGTITLTNTALGGDYLSVDGDYTQGALATLKVDLFAAPAIEMGMRPAGLRATGSVTLDGALELDGDPPAAPRQRIIRAGGARTGTFATVTSHHQPYTALYADNGVDVVPGHAADSKRSVLWNLSAHPRVFTGTTQIRYRSRMAASVKVTVARASRARTPIRPVNVTVVAKPGKNTFRLDARCRRGGLCLAAGRYRVTLAVGAGFPSKSMIVRVRRAPLVLL